MTETFDGKQSSVSDTDFHNYMASNIRPTGWFVWTLSCYSIIKYEAEHCE